jgi:hypothetical protein
LPIDLFLKEKVRSQTFWLRGVDVTGTVEEHEAAGGRLSVLIPNGKPHGHSWANMKQDRQFAAEPQVLVALASVKAEDGFALAGFTAIDERHGILYPQAAQIGSHRRAREHFHLQETVLVVDVLVLLQRLLPLPLHAQFRDAGIDRP